MTRSSPAATYDDDFFAWTQEQAAALRAMPPAAAGAHVDIARVAEEIEDLGKRDLREVRSYLARLLAHLIKIDQAPDSRDAPHWRGDAMNFHVSALEAFTPGMRQSLDISAIWRLRAGTSMLPQRLDCRCGCPRPVLSRSTTCLSMPSILKVRWRH